MKKQIAFTLVLLLSGTIFGQVIDENFDSGLPGSWTQFSSNTVTWTASSDLGVGGSGCAVADFSAMSSGDTSWLQTPFVDLSSLSNPRLTFKTALIKNNFLHPYISLWYDNGSGWTWLTNWGVQWSSPAPQTIIPAPSGPVFPPLDTSGFTWVDIDYDLSALASNNNIRFAFGADFVNGGWVLVEDVKIASTAGPNIYTLPYLQDFEQGVFFPQDWEAFGSNTNASWELSPTVSAWGVGSGCATFDNFSTNLTGNFYGMRTVMFDLTNAVQPMLTFDVAYARRNATNSDRLGIWYSFNGQTGWVNLANYQDGTLTTAPDHTTSFFPMNDEWDSITVDLSQFAGTSLIRFAFENNCRNGNRMYVDNVHFYDAGPSTVSVNETEQENKNVNVFPNPTTGPVTLTTKNIEVSEISIYNKLGQKVQLFIPGDEIYQADISMLSNGLYTIVIETDSGEKFMRKLIKQ